MREIYLSGGSFWALQKYFNLIFGVVKTEACYTNGKTKETSYKKIKETHHAEAIRIVYNPNIISLEEILNYYYNAIDPTSYKKQGLCKGSQYRLGIYYVSDSDLDIIVRSLDDLQARTKGKVAIETEKVKNYVLAEKYHQNFLVNNPFAPTNISTDKYEEVKNKQMSNISYRVMKYKETEKAYDNEYWNFFKEGIYVDKETEDPLFLSSYKYNAKTGYPTFYKPIDGSVRLYVTTKNLKLKSQIISKNSNNYLGDLYYDGPKKLGGLRYSINSASLTFVPKNKMKEKGYGKYIDLL